ncbi:hypothetical protein QCA50_007210 [Cerrena zonata]|uniref:Glycoside hydrolase family 71 protein n=1 Tax=Cerrena zonata TaxID=2478898 RepID=A0AAW0GGY2_9APHY
MLSSLSYLSEALLLSALLATPSNSLPQAGFLGEIETAFDNIFGQSVDVTKTGASVNITRPSITIRPSMPIPTNSIPANLTNPTNPPITSNVTVSKNLVFAHHIVGNTYNYTVQTWQNDISLAASKGIDAFALNIGRDSWESGQVSNAYSAAKSLNTTFKLFISFDMTSLPCASTNDAATIRNYVNSYAAHPNQLQYNNSAFISTFAGESCTFGAASVDQGWTNTVKKNLNSTYFVPSFFVDPATFSKYTVMDGAFNWNSGWPVGNTSITFQSDQTYLANLQNRTYMAGVSPWFFTHYSPQTYNKNFIYRSDDWLFAQRWELLIQNRTQVPFAQVITWNDYGESHYVGPVEGVQPMSQAWVNGFDHQGWLDLMKYYITAYKTGIYPAVTKDRVFTWARLYPAAANSTDPVGKPDNWQWTQDYLWTVSILSAPANVTQTCGNSTSTTAVPAGLSKLKLPLMTNCSVKVVVNRGNTTSLTFEPTGFNFSTSPPSYNFNAFVAASPA